MYVFTVFACSNVNNSFWILLRETVHIFHIRKETSLYWYVVEGSRILAFLYPACSPSVSSRTQVHWTNFFCFKYRYLLRDYFEYSGYSFRAFHAFEGTTNSLNCFYCRKNLPLDLEEGVLQALCLQALGQVIAHWYFDRQHGNCLYISILCHLTF